MASRAEQDEAPRRRRPDQNGKPDESSKEVQRPDKPCHRRGDSLFSSSSGFLNYRGILNDCILLLLLSNFKNVVTNLLNYGLLVDPRKWIGGMVHLSSSPCAVLTLLCGMFPLVALLLEKAAVKRYINDKNLFICNCINIVAVLLFPVGFVVWLQCGPLGSFIALSLYTITLMKLISYAQVNSWCRKEYRNNKGQVEDSESQELVSYPDNLNLTDIAYFVVAPTLCYELNFPRIPKIRKIFLLRRICEAVFLFNVVLALVQQWLIPTIMGSVEPFRNWDIARMMERHLTLAVPSHVLWLMAFYWLFHSVLNVIAELLRFGDRCFYKDWWNSETIAYFWKTWNIPVHRWCSRHMYDPLIERGYSRLTAMAAVFFFSAFFHEYLCSVPLLTLRPWAFGAMIAQIPLAYLTSFPFMRGQLGNVIVWASIVLGQPLAILMYMVEYYRYIN